MTKLPQQFIEDRALRDAARSVLMADIEHAKVSLSGKGIATRVGSRVGDGAKDVLEVAKVHADDKRGILASLIGAAIMFFAREPILEILGIKDAVGEADGDTETEEIDAYDADQSEVDNTIEDPAKDGVAETAPVSGDNDER